MAAGNPAMNPMVNRVPPLLQMLSYPIPLLLLMYTVPKLWVYHYYYLSVSRLYFLDTCKPYKYLIAMPWLVNVNRNEPPR